MKRTDIVMLGTDFSAPGGITAVIRSYRNAGLFDEWPIRFIATYRRDTTRDKVATALSAMRKFLGLLLRGRVAAVHAHSAARASFWRKSLFLVVGGILGARTILHLHSGLFPTYYREHCGFFRRAAIRWMLRRVDRLVVLTPSWVDRLREIEPKARIVVIGNGVEPIKRRREPEPRTVLFLGRLRAEKGIMELLHAASLVAPDLVGLRIVCAGDGDIQELGRIAVDLGIGDLVEFPGWVEGEAKDALLSRATVFALPSHFEGLPVGVLEAMVNGIPVVATRVGGIPDVVNDSCGRLVSPGDVEGLASALREILSDDARRTAMGEACRERVLAEFDMKHVTACVASLYSELGARPLRSINGNDA